MSTTADKLLKEQAEFKANFKPAPKPQPRQGNPVPEPVATVVPSIITELREACEAGATGELVARPAQMASLVQEFAGVGLYARTGHLEQAVTITLSRTIRDVVVNITSPAVWQRAAERICPEFGKAAVTDADLLKALDGLIDRNADKHVPTAVLLDPSMGIEDTAALAELAQRRKVCIARVREDDDLTTPVWRAD